MADDAPVRKVDPRIEVRRLPLGWGYGAEHSVPDVFCCRCGPRLGYRASADRAKQARCQPGPLCPGAAWDAVRALTVMGVVTVHLRPSGDPVGRAL